MSTEFQDYASRLSPPWLSGQQAQLQVRASAAPLDDLDLKARNTMLMRLISYAPSDMLMSIGRERGMLRFPGEPDGIYRRRLLAAWDWWSMAGTRPGMEYILALCGYRSTITEHFGEDGHEHEFSVHLTPVKPVKRDAIWGSPNDTWGGTDAHWGYRLDAVPLSSLRALLDEIKPAHARLRKLTYSSGEHVWGGTDFWGNSETIPTEHLWNSPYGKPSVTFEETGEAAFKWGQGSVEIIYDLYDPLYNV